MITRNLKQRLYTSIVLIALIITIFYSKFFLLYSLIVLGVLSIIEFFGIIKKILKNKYFLIFLNSFFVFYISIFCIFFFALSNIIQFKIVLFILLCGCIASDIGGFVIGKIFKGPKLTKVSPNKTISGSIGSLVFTTIIILLMIYYYTSSFTINVIIISLITSVSCQLGDLIFSFLKRKAKIKDTGNFFPGHGGVLDRIDGILLGTPLGFILFILIY